MGSIIGKGQRILCDLDGICADIYKKWFALINAEFGTRMTVGDLHVYKMAANAPAFVGRRVYKYMIDDGFFDDLEPIAGAVETLNALASDGFDIVFATTPSTNPSSAAEKLRWVRRHFGADPQQVFVCHQKHLIKSDFFIDDAPVHIEAYRKEWPDAQILTIAHPYNLFVSHDLNLRAEGWSQPQKAWAEIDEYIRGVAQQAR